MNTYTTLELEKFEERGIKFSPGLLLLRPIGEFFKRYIMKGGYKDGMHGFIFSMFLAIYKFTAAAKLWAKEFLAEQKANQI